MNDNLNFPTDGHIHVTIFYGLHFLKEDPTKMSGVIKLKTL
jgi:hypothetical protein